MFVLSKIFGECPQVMILEAFADNFEEEISIPDLIWLTNIPKTTIYSYINKLLDEKIILEGDKVGKTQFYHLNSEKPEVKIFVSLINYIVTEKLAEELEERGLKQIEEPEMAIEYMLQKTTFRHLIKKGKNYANEILSLFEKRDYQQKEMTVPKYASVA